MLQIVRKLWLGEFDREDIIIERKVCNLYSEYSLGCRCIYIGDDKLHHGAVSIAQPYTL